MARLLAALAAIVTLLMAFSAEAARVRFVAEDDVPFTRRLRAEIASVGFDVDMPASAQSALQDDVVAVVIVRRAPARVEIWLVGGTPQLRLAEVIRRAPAAPEATDTLRVAERLRAVLQPLYRRVVARLPESASEKHPDADAGSAAAPGPGAPDEVPAAVPPQPDRLTPPAAQVRRPSARPASRFASPRSAPSNADWRLDAAIAILGQPGAPASAIQLRLRRRVYEPLGVSVAGYAPLGGSTFRAGDASASTRAWMFGAGADLGVLESETLQGWLTAGLMMAHVISTGGAAAPRFGRRASIWSSVPFAAADISWRLDESWSLTAGGLLGISVPEVEIAFAGRRVANWGRPLLAARLGFSLWW